MKSINYYAHVILKHVIGEMLKDGYTIEQVTAFIKEFSETVEEAEKLTNEICKP